MINFDQGDITTVIELEGVKIDGGTA